MNASVAVYRFFEGIFGGIIPNWKDYHLKGQEVLSAELLIGENVIN